MTEGKDRSSKDAQDAASEIDSAGTGRREFLKSAGVAAATAGAAAASIGAASADVPSQGYQPTDSLSVGQWPSWATINWSEFPSDDPEEHEVWGYTGAQSYAPGDTLDLHVNVNPNGLEYSVEIVRDGAEMESVYKQDGLKGKKHPTPTKAYTEGCGWPVEHSMKIPGDWQSGGYVVIFRIKDGDKVKEQEGFFILRSAERKGDIALVIATSTWNAYNNWAGGSSYTNPELKDFTDLDAARTSGFVPVLSTDRPWPRGMIRIPEGAPRHALKNKVPPNWSVHYDYLEYALSNGYAITYAASGWAMYDSMMARWLERNGYKVDYLTQHDLHFDSGALDGYKCVMTCGHDEYWSRPMREHLDDYIENGGNLARFGGNMIWQIRLSDDGSVQTCYKYIADEKDPERNDPKQNTHAFEAKSINWPPATTFGVNGCRGVYSRLGGSMPRSSGGFTVYRNNHWAFEGSDLYYGDVFGEEVPIVGYESDGLDYTFRYGLPYPTGEDGAPESIEILAMTPCILEEEDHGHFGQSLDRGDGDWRTLTKAVYGDNSPENLAKMRYGSCVVVSMKKGKGEVFCAGTTEWPYALKSGEWFSEKITHNVLKRFTA
jgi:hypothetical protein